jgi:periplasmic protein CpxP/Spy
MKKTFLLLFAAFSLAATLNAQPGGFRRTIEERVAIVHHKIDSAFKLEPAKLTQVDSAFANYFRSQDKLREELMSGGQRPDMQVMREKMQPIMAARDAELKGIFSEDQYKKWKEEIEPSLRPQRPQGGGNGNNR